MVHMRFVPIFVIDAQNSLRLSPLAFPSYNISRKKALFYKVLWIKYTRKVQ